MTTGECSKQMEVAQDKSTMIRNSIVSSGHKMKAA